MNARVLIAICVLLTTTTVTQSRRWFAPEVGRWITQEKVPASWEDAKRRCERDGAVLASPLNTQLHNYLSRINNDSVAYFIGIRATRSGDGQKVHYASVEGTRLDDMPMAVFFAITQLNLEQDDCLSMDREGIHAVSCLDHLPYICYSKVPLPLGYTYYPATRSAYKVHHYSWVSWHVANTTCAGEGAHLLVLNDAEEADIVARIVTDAASNLPYTWTGLRDNRPPGGVMDWRTVHGEPLSNVYNVWGGGGPQKKPGYTCAYFNPYNKVLCEHPCGWTWYFTCEISQY